MSVIYVLQIGAIYCKISLYRFICVLMFMFYSLLCSCTFIVISGRLCSVSYGGAVLYTLLKLLFSCTCILVCYFPCWSTVQCSNVCCNFHWLSRTVTHIFYPRNLSGIIVVCCLWWCMISGFHHSVFFSLTCGVVC